MDMGTDDQSQTADSGLDRRTLLQAWGGAAGIAALAGCTGGNNETPDDDDTGNGSDGDSDEDVGDGIQGEYWRDLPEPETREGYLQRANLAAHQEAPWIFLHQQQSVYGKTTRIEWDPRPDEYIKAREVTPVEDGSDLIITQGQLDSGLDPHDHRETTTDNVVLQSYERLLRRDREGNLNPGLATDWERIEEGRVRFYIREGVTFHNGDPLQPSDVVYSIRRIVDSDVGGLESPQSDQLAGVQDAEVVDGERAVDVISDGINPVIFQYFASYCYIVQEDWIENRASEDINTDMNGTGPFQVTEYTPDEEVVYEAYPDYWDGEPDVQQLFMRAAEESSTRVSQLLEGETDIIVNVPPQEVARVQDEDSTELAPVPSTRVIYNGMRYDVEPFSDPMFRRALNYAIDLESIIDDVLQGFGDATGQPTLPGYTGYNEDIDPYPYDPELADQLIEQAGYAGEELELETPVGRYLGDLSVAQAVAGYVDDLETVSASVQQRDFGTLAGELTDGDIETMPPWYLIGWGNATFDASQTLIPLLTSDGALTSYRDDEFDALIDAAQSMGGDQ